MEQKNIAQEVELNGEHDNDHKEAEHLSETASPFWKRYRAYFPAIASFALLISGIAFDNWIKADWFTGFVRLAWYVAAYLPVGFPVVRRALKGLPRGDYFNEFSLMSLATIGAFAIGEYPEGVAVMLFYAVGELFQDAAVNAAKRNIKALLDVRPDTATVLRNGNYIVVAPEKVEVGETIQIKPGEKVPLDGTMLSETASFNTSALTGESKPRTIRQGEEVLAGMLSLDKGIEIKVTKPFEDSSLAKILFMVQDATKRKAQTERFIYHFAKVYTPIVFYLAVALTFLPYFFVESYIFKEWLYRALVFLVISCPCALVVSIPLGYFGGIGAASRYGILFKGSNYLDLMTRLNTVVMDKTGTLTKGVFEVQEVKLAEGVDISKLTAIAAALENQSTHPVARAIVDYANAQKMDFASLPVAQVEEISGHGLKGTVDGQELLAGNQKLMDKFGIQTPKEIADVVNTTVIIAANGRYQGYFIIADELKEDAQLAITNLHKQGIKTIIMLSGDKTAVTQQVGKALGIDQVYGDLLPENKVEKLEELKKDPTRVLAFVGDGINDAPSLALADVGIAMGAMGSDVAIETADVILQTDQPAKIAQAIQISKATRRVVWQNIGLAFTVKAIVLVLGAGGLATMWEAVFADVGVALLAILNAVRIQKMKFG
jgi:Cd2+/Zn2+-exporting ATPase